MLYSINTAVGVCCTRGMHNSVYTVLGICCTRCMLSSLYVVLCVDSCPWHGEIDWNNLTSCSYVMVEIRTRQREMRGYGGNYHKTLGLKRIPCASQLSIADTEGRSPDPAYYYTHTRSSEPNWASCTPYCSCPLISSTSFSSSSPISRILVHNSTIIAEHIFNSSRSISPSHDDMFAPCEAYTEYSIHRVQHTLSTAFTEYSIYPRFCVFPSF